MSVDESKSERSEFDMKSKNPYYNPPRDPSNALSTYISAIKNDVTEAVNKRNHQKSNLTMEERAALSSLNGACIEKN